MPFVDRSFSNSKIVKTSSISISSYQCYHSNVFFIKSAEILTHCESIAFCTMLMTDPCVSNSHQVKLPAIPSLLAITGRTWPRSTSGMRARSWLTLGAGSTSTATSASRVSWTDRSLYWRSLGRRRAAVTARRAGATTWTGSWARWTSSPSKYQKQVDHYINPKTRRSQKNLKSKHP